MTSRLLLIDSSAFIEFSRRRGDAVIADRVQDAVAQKRAAVCSCVAAEVLSGCKSKAEWVKVMGTLAFFEWLDTTDECWLRAAALGFNLRRQGLTVPLTDRLVLAISRVHEVELLHCDAHYDLMADVSDVVA
jgi:predicted nucleic acid-binding protein